IVVCRCLPLIRQVITPVVTGIVVLLIGLTLIKVGLVSMGGGFAAMQDGSFGSLQNLGLSLLVLLTIVLLQRSQNPWLRLSAIVIAMMLGYGVAFLLGRVTLPTLPEEWIALPRILHVGLAFDWYLFIPITVIFVVTALEAIG
ncbi:solute carrier family 23 protein, partial [Aeromonas salmonicida]|uniref:solute carrier family 23 protein n=1 Tax=Aeromonas salmonicida TaxID=645 RepID=UPI0023AA49B8